MIEGPLWRPLGPEKTEYDRVCLGIMLAKVQGKGSERMIEMYALLNNGSEVTLCHEILAKELKLNGDRLSFTLTGMTGSARGERKFLIDLVARSMGKSATSELLKVKQ